MHRLSLKAALPGDVWVTARSRFLGFAQRLYGCFEYALAQTGSTFPQLLYKCLFAPRCQAYADDFSVSLRLSFTPLSRGSLILLGGHESSLGHKLNISRTHYFCILAGVKIFILWESISWLESLILF